jgi:hypothetical protein
MSSEPIFGVPAEWEGFVKENQGFMDNWGPLRKTMEDVFLRSGLGGIGDKVTFFLGRQCADRFSGIVLLCGNGRGAAAMKLLRSLYENAGPRRTLQ